MQKNKHWEKAVLNLAIKQTYKDDEFWQILLNESNAQSGPFDGGCLICAKAIMNAADGSELVRIVSPLNGGQTEHYGVRLSGKVYDFDGIAHSSQQWIDRFQSNESITDRELSFAVGYDSTTQTPDDPRAVRLISKTIMRKMIGQKHAASTTQIEKRRL